MNPGEAGIGRIGGVRFTLHAVTAQRDLDRLGRAMDNCIASYGRHRLAGRHRIVEVRKDGRTRYALHLVDGRIEMFEGHRNTAPTPADVPVVRDLLRGEGYLDPRLGVRSSPPTARPMPRQRPAVRAATPAGAVPGGRPPAPPPPPLLTVQELATDLLRPPALGRTEWPELAAALWAVGILPRLPDPSELAFERVILDLAGRLSVSAEAGLPRGTSPTATERAAEGRRLVAGPPPTTLAGWQRHRMAEVLRLDPRL